MLATNPAAVTFCSKALDTSAAHTQVDVKGMLCVHIKRNANLMMYDANFIAAYTLDLD
jgi:hypothetical protein